MFGRQTFGRHTFGRHTFSLHNVCDKAMTLLLGRMSNARLVKRTIASNKCRSVKCFSAKRCEALILEPSLRNFYDKKIILNLTIFLFSETPRGPTL
jgi:hypothetical protein